MSILQINGVRFLSGAWAADEVQVAFAPTDGGLPSWQLLAHDPSGPNSGVVTGSVSVVTWTDTLIELDFDENSVDGYAAVVLLRDVTDTENEVFDITPDIEVHTIDVSYDSGTDELVIVADNPIFTDYDTEGWMDIVGTATNAAVGLNSAYVSPTELRYPGAFAAFSGPTTITHIDFKRGPVYAGSVIENTWNGSVSLSEVSVLLAGVNHTDLDLLTGGYSCPGVVQIEPHGILVVVLDDPGAVLDGANVTYSDASTEHLDTGNSTQVVEFSPGAWAIENDAIVGKQIVSVEAVDAFDLPIAPPVAVADGLGLVLELDTAIIDGTEINITFVPPSIGDASLTFDPAKDMNLTLRGCSELGGDTFSEIIYNPLGPNAGSNDPGLIINQWDENGIQIDTTLYDAPHTVNAFDLQMPGVGAMLSHVINFYIPDPSAYPNLLRGYSPALDTIVLEGKRFITAALGPLGVLTLRFDDPNNDGRLNTFYRPNPGDPGNLGMTANDPAVTIVEWTDERIEIIDTRFTSVGLTFPGDMPFVVNGGALADETGTAYYYYEDKVKTGSFPVDGTGTPPTATDPEVGDFMGNAVGYFDAGNHEIGIFGDGFATFAVDHVDVFVEDGLGGSMFLARWYKAGSPNVGLNPPGSTQSGVFDAGGGTGFQFGAPILAGETVTAVLVYDAGETYAVPGEAKPPLEVPI